jgi:hypothetical protein
MHDFNDRTNWVIMLTCSWMIEIHILDSIYRGLLWCIRPIKLWRFCIKSYVNCYRDAEVNNQQTVSICCCIKQVCRSQKPHGLRRGSAAFNLLGLLVRISSEAWMSVFVGAVCCQVEVSSLCRTDHSSRWVLPIIVYLCMMVKPRLWGGLGPLGAHTHG